MSFLVKMEDAAKDAKKDYLSFITDLFLNINIQAENFSGEERQSFVLEGLKEVLKFDDNKTLSELREDLFSSKYFTDMYKSGKFFANSDARNKASVLIPNEKGEIELKRNLAHFVGMNAALEASLNKEIDEFKIEKLESEPEPELEAGPFKDASVALENKDWDAFNKVFDDLNYQEGEDILNKLLDKHDSPKKSVGVHTLTDAIRLHKLRNELNFYAYDDFIETLKDVNDDDSLFLAQISFMKHVQMYKDTTMDLMVESLIQKLFDHDLVSKLFDDGSSTGGLNDAEPELLETAVDLLPNRKLTRFITTGEASAKDESYFRKISFSVIWLIRSKCYQKG